MSGTLWKRAQEAWNVLLPVVDKFPPQKYIVGYYG
jgi:hypothetical protein